MTEIDWIEKYQLQPLLNAIQQKGCHHALVTQCGVSFSTATLTEYELLYRQKDAAYVERNKCVALIARMAVALGLDAGLGRHEGEDWEDDWRNIVFVDLPSGQVSWHIHDSDLGWFEFLGQYKGVWDGHSTEEKYQRVLNPSL